jgi:predicted amidohydrolase
MTQVQIQVQPKSPIRVGCVQWQMRAFASVEQLMQLVSQQVAALASYQCDFIVFPEFFTAPLLSLHPELDTHSSMRQLATYTATIQQAMLALAVQYKVNIIAGSMPVLQSKRLFNVSYLCHRSGKLERFAKLHPTPGEKKDWDMRGGDKLRAFNTDCGKIGILICYDVEFPEAPRLLAAQGIDVLFVPFWTDSKQGYQRVRYCAQARAIENEIYVVLAGSVGCLPQANCLDVQYAQSAVFSPSDFGFPHDAIVAEATTNVETTLVTELDLNKLVQVRQRGSVRNNDDKRADLYAVKWLGEKLKSASKSVKKIQRNKASTKGRG